MDISDESGCGSPRAATATGLRPDDRGRGLDAGLRRLVLGLALLLIIVMGVVTVYRAAFSAEQRSDFMVLRAVGQAVRSGQNIYAAHNARGWAYFYPPPMAILMVPFTLVNVFWGALLWYGLSVGLIVSAVRFCVTMTDAGGAPGHRRFWLYALSFGMVSLWIIQGVAEGQATVLLLWLVVAALYWSRTGRESAGGVAWAGALLLKVFPAALLVYFVWRRRWRLLGATAGALVAGALLLPALVYGWQRNLDYWRAWGMGVAKPLVAANDSHEPNPVDDQLLNPYKSRSQTIQAVIWRWAGDRTARAVALGVAGLMVLVMALVARQPRPEHDLLIASAVVVWMLLILPLSQFHYHMLMLLPMTVLTWLALGGAAATVTRPARGVLIVYPLTAVGTLVSPALRQAGLLCWATLGVWGMLVWITHWSRVTKTSLRPSGHWQVLSG